MIVFDDADLDATVPLLVAAVTTFAGQFCMTGSRILVHGAWPMRCAPASRALSRASGSATGSIPNRHGPADRQGNVARVDDRGGALAYAKPIVRGGPGDRRRLRRGGVLPADAARRPRRQHRDRAEGSVRPSRLRIVRQRVRRNRTRQLHEMGLSAAIFTNDLNISRRVSRELQAGTVWTNTWAAINDGFAEGGFKQSGAGRLRGPLAIATSGSQDRRPLIRRCEHERHAANPIDVVGEWLQHCSTQRSSIASWRLTRPTSHSTARRRAQQDHAVGRTSTARRRSSTNPATMFARWRTRRST